MKLMEEMQRTVQRMDTRMRELTVENHNLKAESKALREALEAERATGKVNCDETVRVLNWKTQVEKRIMAAQEKFLREITVALAHGGEGK